MLGDVQEHPSAVPEASVEDQPDTEVSVSRWPGVWAVAAGVELTKSADSGLTSVSPMNAPVSSRSALPPPTGQFSVGVNTLDPKEHHLWLRNPQTVSNRYAKHPCYLLFDSIKSNRDVCLRYGIVCGLQINYQLSGVVGAPLRTSKSISRRYSQPSA